jgi:hypothetical protein
MKPRQPLRHKFFGYEYFVLFFPWLGSTNTEISMVPIRQMAQPDKTKQINVFYLLVSICWRVGMGTGETENDRQGWLMKLI